MFFLLLLFLRNVAGNICGAVVLLEIQLLWEEFLCILGFDTISGGFNPEPSINTSMRI